MPDIKDSVVRLYVKRFILPRALIFDKPGFVDFKISGKTTIQLRQLLLPETFFVKLEEKIVGEFGVEGEKRIYSVGKKFGYSFAQNGRFENIKDHPGDKVKDWVVIASKFVEGTYASNISQTVDLKKQNVDYSLKNFVVCRKLGYDYLLATGGAAGLIAWILQEPNIEGRLYDSKRSEDNHTCKVKCAPIEQLNKEFKDKVYSEISLNNLDQNKTTYESFNKEVNITYKKSLQTYLNAKVFNYNKGIISYKNRERFFLMEVSGVYLVEKELQDDRMKKLIFESAFEVGKELFGEFNKKNQLGVMELLSALGWGEVLVLPSGGRLKIAINYFPWTKYYKEIDYNIIGGLLSGIFSRIYGKTITFKKPKTDISKGHLALLFEQVN